MQRIRLCQLITELQPAGAERVVYELATRLDKRRFDVHVAALQGGAVAQRLERAGIPVMVLGVRGKWDVLKLRVLRRFLAGSGQGPAFDIVHTHLFHADLAGRLAAPRAGVKHLVHTVHLVEQRCRPWQFAFQRWTDRRCDRIICVSPSVMEHHAARTHLPRRRYTMIPNGVDVSAFAPDAQRRAQLRRLWDIGDREIVVAYVGRLAKEKGFEVFLSAMRRILNLPLSERDQVKGLNECPRIHFVVAGFGPLQDEVVQLSRNHPFCRYLGFLSDVRDPLNAADIFALPSFGEGWPMAMTEAMAARLACIGANVTGLRDMIDDGQTGLLIPPDNPAALIAAIVRLAADPTFRNDLAFAARAQAVEHYSIEQNVRAHEQLYEQIVGGPSRPSAT